jgi:hypothetical protein
MRSNKAGAGRPVGHQRARCMRGKRKGGGGRRRGLRGENGQQNGQKIQNKTREKEDDTENETKRKERTNRGVAHHEPSPCARGGTNANAQRECQPRGPRSRPNPRGSDVDSLDRASSCPVSRGRSRRHQLGRRVSRGMAKVSGPPHWQGCVPCNRNISKRRKKKEKGGRSQKKTCKPAKAGSVEKAKAARTISNGQRSNGGGTGGQARATHFQDTRARERAGKYMSVTLHC